MNLLMAGMIPTVMILRSGIASAAAPTTARFWFVMSMGLLVGFITAYPMNWWLVTYHLKHGMMTVRPPGAAAGASGHGVQASMDGAPPCGAADVRLGWRRGTAAPRARDGAALVPCP